VLMLDTKNTLIGTNVVSIGTLAASPVSASNLFKAAILTNSAQILVVHNHPSGIPDPSYEDQQVTAKIKEAGKILDIQLIDHIIVGEGRWYSFKEAGQV
jgi:DNA repair protein RadC